MQAIHLFNPVFAQILENESVHPSLTKEGAINLVESIIIILTENGNYVGENGQSLNHALKFLIEKPRQQPSLYKNFIMIMQQYNFTDWIADLLLKLKNSRQLDEHSEAFDTYILLNEIITYYADYSELFREISLKSVNFKFNNYIHNLFNPNPLSYSF